MKEKIILAPAMEQERRLSDFAVGYEALQIITAISAGASWSMSAKVGGLVTQ